MAFFVVSGPVLAKAEVGLGWAWMRRRRRKRRKEKSKGELAILREVLALLCLCVVVGAVYIEGRASFIILANVCVVLLSVATLQRRMS